MDWEYYIDNDLSNSIVRGGVFFLAFRFWNKHINKSKTTSEFLKFLENTLWHPKNCIINMKSNTRYFYTIMSSVIGICIIKNLYFHFRKRKELDANLNDFALIGSVSGIYLAGLSLGIRYMLYGGMTGMIYGITYHMLLRFFVNKTKRNAAKIGIML